MLASLDLTELEERAYVALLEHPRSTVAEVAALLSVTRRRAETALKSLEVKGAISRSPDRVAHYIPAPPSIAVEALIARKQDELQHARLAATRLDERVRLVASGRKLPEDVVEIVTGREAVSHRARQLQEGAREEILAFDKPPYADTNPPDHVNVVESEALARGVAVRVVYAHEALELPGRHDHLRQMVELGEQARAFAQLPLKLVIVDRRVALVPLTLHEPDLSGAALIVRSSSLLDALQVLFETIWERATPVHFTRSGDREAGQTVRPPARADSLVPLLAAGLKDSAVARQLGLSTRTFERRVSELMTGLDAQTRFQAGWLAALRAERRKRRPG